MSEVVEGKTNDPLRTWTWKMDLGMYNDVELEISPALCESQINKKTSRSVNVPSRFVNGKIIPRCESSWNVNFLQETMFRERSVNLRKW